jgi:hypothetical protein
MAEKPALAPSPLAYVVDRFISTQVIHEPYPHFFLEDVFPNEYYQFLLKHLPESAIYQNLYAVTDLKLDHFRHRDQRDLNGNWTEKLPDDIKSFWIDFERWFLGPEMAQTVLRSFAGPLRERFGGEDQWPEVSVEAQLIRHRAGYFLGPHSDLYSKLVVLLLYLPHDDRAAHLGTSIYRPKVPGFTCANSVHYSFEDFDRVKIAPYKPNSLLAFFRTDSSFHGVEPLSDQDVSNGDRDLIQYVLYDKQERRAQLRKRRPAASEEAASEGDNE